MQKQVKTIVAGIGKKAKCTKKNNGVFDRKLLNIGAPAYVDVLLGIKECLRKLETMLRDVTKVRHTG